MMISYIARQAFVDRGSEAVNVGEIVEISRFFGGSCVAMALSIGDHNKKVHSIDITTDPLFNSYTDFYKVKDKITCYNGGSYKTNQFYKKKFGKNVSFVFIDGDHSDEGIALDIRSWSELLMSGGTICMHEYGHNDINQSTRVIYEEIISKHDKFYDFKRV